MLCSNRLDWIICTRNAPNVNVSTKEKLLDNSTADTISNNLPKSLHTSVCEDKFSLDQQSLSSGTDLIYPLTPNICVEAGRIEFIRSPLDGTTIIPYSYGEENGNVPLESEEFEGGKEEKETCDENDKTAALEARIQELEENLELERKLVQKEKLVSAKLQRQLSRVSPPFCFSVATVR
ncbi:hypothetical protein M8J76_004101 [Diaphorina citri]|nr:hypothetical protein M8J76_004101 [Diaphorina citri]